MYREIYIDLVFVTNLVMDYILLRIVGIIFRYKGSRKRCLAAAGLGALFSCVMICIEREQSLLTAILLHGVCAAGMLKLGYKIRKGSLLVKTVILLYLTAFLIGGFWQVLSADRRITFRFFLLSAACTYFGISTVICSMDTIRTRTKNIYPITLSYQGKVRSAYGFYDTGNLLQDPISGEPVSIMKSEVLETILSGELIYRLKHLQENPGELKSTELAGLRPHFLPYQTVEKREGIMLAVTLEDLCIHTPREVVHVSRPVFALSFEPSTLENEYKVLLNSRLL